MNIKHAILRTMANCFMANPLVYGNVLSLSISLLIIVISMEIISMVIISICIISMVIISMVIITMVTISAVTRVFYYKDHAYCFITL